MTWHPQRLPPAHAVPHPLGTAGRRGGEVFGRNGFFVLVGDRQVEDLDAELGLDEASEVAFVSWSR